MSQQIQISGGAKVRDLQDVIIGTSGVLSSLAFNVANGVPKLDSNGKILVAQLPNSVMEYLGTWSAATNTPTLANGTGNQGDVYLCNVAGTVDFGAGPIAFFVGDQVIYSGSIWQRASGATGTVTSVAVTESGDSLNITGSPITTSGTINIGFNGTNLQYVNGAGNLTTFPILTGYVPYTGATANVDLGVFDLTADLITGATGSFASSGGSDTFAINHSSGSGIALNITKGGNGEGLYINKTSGSGNAATIVGTLNATTLVKSGGTSSQFLKADGTVDSNTYALDSLVVHLAGTETITGAKTFSGATAFSSTTTHSGVASFGTGSPTAIGTDGTLIIPKIRLYNGTPASIYSDFVSAATINRSIVVPDASGTLALTSDLSGYVTLATTQTISGVKTFELNTLQVDGGILFKDNVAPTSIASGYVKAYFNINGTKNSLGLVSSATSPFYYTYDFPNNTGTLALISDIPSLTGYVNTSGSPTNNYLPKFTAASTIANSGVYDNGTNVIFGGTANTSANPTVVMQNRLGTVLSVAGFNWAGTTTDNNSVNSLMVIGGYLNTSAQTVATATTASGMQFYDGGFYWYGNSGLTIGSVYTNTQRMFLTVAGNLMINSSNADTGYKLDVNGTGRFVSANNTTALTISAGSSATFEFKGNSTSGYASTFNINNTALYIGHNSASRDLVLQTASVDRLTISGSGAATFTGALNGTSATFSSKVDSVNPTSNTVNLTVATGYNFNGYQSYWGTRTGTAFDFNLDVYNSGTQINALKILQTGAATFSSSVTATSATLGADGVGGGGANVLKFNYEANASSRSWRLVNDETAFGDFSIQQSTTRTGSAYQTIMNFSPTRQVQVYGTGNTMLIQSDNNTLSLGLGYAGTIHGYLGGFSSRIEAYSNNGGYVYLSSSSTWIPASDIKRKRNFETYSLGLNAILGLKPKLYNMDFQKDGDDKQLGLVAQEVKEFIPLAFEQSAEFIGLNYNYIIVTMVNAIKELKAEIDNLKNK